MFGQEYMSEADALNEWSDEGCDEFEEEYEEEERTNRKAEVLRERRQRAMDAKIGAEIACAYCNKKMIKKSYNQVFCSNGRTCKGRSSCKDKYWNTVDRNRRARKEAMA